MATTNTALEWHRVADVNELPVGRVKTVTAGTHSFALTNIDGQFTAMDNRCPHQGGPLGEGSIEVGNDGQCWLRCPWHGWDFDPTTGRSPGGHEDSGQQLYPVELREDGVYVGVEAELAHETHSHRRHTEGGNHDRCELEQPGVTTVFGMVGHASNLGAPLGRRRTSSSGDPDVDGYATTEFVPTRPSGMRVRPRLPVRATRRSLTGKPAACLTHRRPRRHGI